MIGTSVYVTLHLTIELEKKRLEEAWERNRQAVKLELEEIEELEDIPISTKL